MCIEEISSGNTSSANYIVQLKLQYLLIKLGKKKKEKEKKSSCVFSTFYFSFFHRSRSFVDFLLNHNAVSVQKCMLNCLVLYMCIYIYIVCIYMDVYINK